MIFLFFAFFFKLVLFSLSLSTKIRQFFRAHLNRCCNDLSVIAGTMSGVCHATLVRVVSQRTLRRA